MITLIDTQQSNISSVRNMLKRIGVAAQVAQTPAEVLSAEKLILPGVGQFATVMKWLNESGYRAALDAAVKVNKTPILGICLGMQLMTNHSEEGDAQGLGWVDAEVREFKNIAPLPVPHMGWNDVRFREGIFANGYSEDIPPRVGNSEPAPGSVAPPPLGGRVGGGRSDAPLLPTMAPPQPSPYEGGSLPRFYFVHSYYVSCANAADVLGETEYGHSFVSAFRHGNIVGAQFHPEKSHAFGMNFLKRFAEDFHG